MRYIAGVPFLPLSCRRARAVCAALVVVVGSGCDLVASITSPPPNAGVPTESAEVVALAGPDLVVLQGASVTLSGSGSRALVGAPALSWSQRAGPAAPLSNPSSPTPTFTAPHGPARLVFALTATVDDEHDTDEVVIDIVTSSPLPRPQLQLAPPDVTAADDEPVVLRIPWRGVGGPSVRPRCALRSTTSVVIDNGELAVDLQPAELPCAVVIDDSGLSPSDGSEAAGGRANRIAVVVWPENVALPGATRATTRALVDPGAVVDIVAADAIVSVVDGTPVSLESTERGVRLVAPRRVGPLAIVVERRIGGVSGGTLSLPLAVRAGNANAPPVLEPVADLAVRPGARFRIIARATDPDGDAVSIVQRQVLGDEASVDVEGGDARIAPDTAGVLLFHMHADDGVVTSEPIAVRVIVDPAAENRAPVLSLPASVWVVPGAEVIIDASSARDPDTGAVAAYQIQQQPDDAVIVLAAPSDVPRFTFVAPDAGATLRFTVSAYDDGGLGVSVPVTVRVERAGPFVDVARGDDVEGDGSAAAPFSTIAGALATAARHRFAALRLAGGPQAPFDGALPDGLGLVGGHRFDGNTYVDGGAGTVLPLGGAGLALSGGGLEQLTLTGGPLRVARSVSLLGVTLDGGVAVAPGASLVATDTVVGGGVTAVRASVSLLRCGVAGGLDLVQTSAEFLGGTLQGEPALRARGGAVFFADVDVRSSSGGLDLRDASAVVAGRIVVDGGAAAVAGIVAAGDSAVTLEGPVVDVVGTAVADGIVVADGTAVGGRAVVSVTAAVARAIGGTSIDLVDSVLGATGDDVVVVDVADARLERTRITANGPRAVALRAVTGSARASLLRATPRESATAGVDAVGAVVGDVTLQHTTVMAPTGVRGAGGIPSLRNAAIVAQTAFDGVVDVDVVGVVGGVIDPAACPRCIGAPASAIDVDGNLVADDVLGAANPLVDAGDADDAVALDIGGDAVPVGDGPDLGADERAGR